MQALVDGDIVVYRSAFAAEHTFYTLHDTGGGDHPSQWTEIDRFDSAAEMKKYIKENSIEDYAVSTDKEIEPVENVLYSIKHTLTSIMEELKADSCRIFLSKGECFRHKRATLSKYKGNRDDAVRPVHYDAAREYLINHWDAEVYTTIEADDALALYQTDDTCICSIDKDLLQIKGKHYNWVKGTKSLVKPRAALCRLWEQVLTGDGTDNIPGIKGIGAVKAKKLIAECKTATEMEDLCVREWTKALAEGKVQKIDIVKFDNTGLLHYKGWDGETVRIKTVRGVVKEIHMLILVGGEYAKEALDES